MKKRNKKMFVVVVTLLTLISAGLWIFSYFGYVGMNFSVKNRFFMLARTDGAGECHLVLSTNPPVGEFLRLVLYGNSMPAIPSPTDPTVRNWYVYDTPHELRDFEYARGRLMAASAADIFGHRIPLAPPPGSPAVVSLRAPFWALTLAMALIPAVVASRRAVRGVREAQRARHGLCLQCGYNLRAHKPGDKCPECGMVIPVSPAGSQQ
jgi:hypothetical protein